MLFRQQRQAAAKETQMLTAAILRTTIGASDSSKCYTSLPPPLPPSKNPKETHVYVENGDSLTVANKWKDQRANVGVLNMASDRHPGGGWLRGALAQEESLCLRSTLAVTLKRSYYPLPQLGAIWSPSVVVFRDELQNDCRMLDAAEQYQVGVVSVPGLRRPPLTGDELDYRYPRDVEAMQNKIRQILRLTAMSGITHLVLGALGCGVFANPPKRVARIFRNVILEEEFKGHFDEIVFGILDPKREGNLGVFESIIGDFTIPSS